MLAAVDTGAAQPGRIEAPPRPAAAPGGASEPTAKAAHAAEQEQSGAHAAAAGGHAKARLSAEGEAELRKLQDVDRQVRQHEQAHRAAGGNLTGPATYQYQRGPDGQLYAVSGEVSIQVPSGGEPEERIRQLEQVIAAALAPADPSPQDRAVAGRARALIAEARADLAEQEREEGQDDATDPADTDGGPAPAAAEDGAAAYERANDLAAHALAANRHPASLALSA